MAGEVRVVGEEEVLQCLCSLSLKLFMKIMVLDNQILFKGMRETH